MKNELTFSVNGVEKNAPLGSESSFGELIELIRGQYSSDSSCIASIRVDGQEISEAEEAAIALLPLADLRQVEVFTAHPRELAEETLQNLIVFTDHLAALSQQAGEQFRSGGHPSLELAKLFDGMQTFSEALDGAKQVLRIGKMDPVTMLEADLLSITQDLLTSYHDGNHAYLIDLLEKHLPENMADWRDDGLIALIRSRDS